MLMSYSAVAGDRYDLRAGVDARSGRPVRGRDRTPEEGFAPRFAAESCPLECVPRSSRTTERRFST